MTLTSTIRLHPQTATVTLRLHEEQAAPVHARIVVMRDGQRLQAEAEWQPTGDRAFSYTLPWGHFGARVTGAMPRRLGETRGPWWRRLWASVLGVSGYIAWAEIEGVIKGLVDLEATVAPAPAVPFHSSIAFDAASSAELFGAGTLAWDHTVAAGSDRCLVIGFADSGWITEPTNVTYNTDAATEVDTATNGGGPVAALYRLVNPDTGTHSVSMSVTGQVTNLGGAISYTGVDQTTPFGTAAPATGSGTDPTVNVSSASGELVVDVLSTGGTITDVGTGQDDRVNRTNFLGMSEEAGAASVTMSWTTTSAAWAIVGAPLKPAAAGGATDAQKMVAANQLVQSGGMVGREYI